MKNCLCSKQALLTRITPKKIIILPGGGVKGIISSSLLAGYNPLGTIQHCCTTVGSTSVGTILACLYGVGMTFGDVNKKMIEAIPSIFATKWWNPYGVWGPMHDATVLEAFLRKYVSLPFGDLSTEMFCTAINFATGKVKVFDNITKYDDIGLMAWKVARASSSAPTYFAPFDCESTAYIDGGLFENIPAMATCMGLHSKCDTPFEEMDVFIIGTGQQQSTTMDLAEMKSWGIKNWSSPMVEMLTKSNEMSSVFLTQQLPLYGLHYFNPVVLESGWKMNDPKLVPRLLEMTAEHQADFNKEFGAWINKKT